MHNLRDQDRFWRGLLSQCKRARAKQEVNPKGVSARDLTYCSHKPVRIGTTIPERSVLITIITWRLQFHPVNVSNLHVKGVYVLEARAVSRAPPIVYVTWCPLNDGNCRLIIPIVNGRYAREALPHAFNIGGFEYGKSNHTKIKHIYNEFETLNESCDVVFVTHEITWRRAYVFKRKPGIFYTGITSSDSIVSFVNSFTIPNIQRHVITRETFREVKCDQSHCSPLLVLPAESKLWRHSPND